MSSENIVFILDMYREQALSRLTARRVCRGRAISPPIYSSTHLLQVSAVSLTTLTLVNSHSLFPSHCLPLAPILYPSLYCPYYLPLLRIFSPTTTLLPTTLSHYLSHYQLPPLRSTSFSFSETSQQFNRINRHNIYTGP